MGITLTKPIQKSKYENKIDSTSLPTKTNTNNDETTCAICFEEKTDCNIGIRKWTCPHTFHAECLAKWTNTCPMCRCESLNTTYSAPLNISQVNIEFFDKKWKDIPPVPEDNVSIYDTQWEHTQCKLGGHTIRYIHGFSVLGICMHCQAIQSFNLQHIP